MPCRDYESDSWGDSTKWKKQSDKLARIACKAMEELERNGIEDLLLLKDDEVRSWWKNHKEEDARVKAIAAEKERKRILKEEALAKLSSEEREVLGLTPKRQRPKKTTPEEDSFDSIVEAYDKWEAAEMSQEDEIEKLWQHHQKLARAAGLR